MVKWFNAHRPADCPRCGSARIWGHGVCESGVDRYQCGHCHRTFTPVTGTVFDSFKIPPSEWMECRLHLFPLVDVNACLEGESLRDDRRLTTMVVEESEIVGTADGQVLLQLTALVLIFLLADLADQRGQLFILCQFEIILY
jgi:DNA-directed RNA polymerase subunit RPC12/RpoP